MGRGARGQGLEGMSASAGRGGKAEGVKAEGVRPVVGGEMPLLSLRQMSDEASMHEISEVFSILASIRAGEAAADAGRKITHEALKQRSLTWTTKQAD